mgnify:CR=1 FL=1
MKNNQKKTYLTDKKKSIIVEKMLSKYDECFPHNDQSVLRKKTFIWWTLNHYDQLTKLINKSKERVS